MAHKSNACVYLRGFIAFYQSLIAEAHTSPSVASVGRLSARLLLPVRLSAEAKFPSNFHKSTTTALAELRHPCAHVRRRSLVILPWMCLIRSIHWAEKLLLKSISFEQIKILRRMVGHVWKRTQKRRDPSLFVWRLLLWSRFVRRRHKKTKTGNFGYSVILLSALYYLPILIFAGVRRQIPLPPLSPSLSLHLCIWWLGGCSLSTGGV